MIYFTIIAKYYNDKIQTTIQIIFVSNTFTEFDESITDTL